MDNPVPPVPPSIPTPPPIAPPPIAPTPPAISANFRQPPRKPSTNRGWMALSIVLMSLIAIYMVFTVGESFIKAGGGKSSMHGRHALEEVVIEDNGATDKIAVIDVKGIISGDSIDHGGLTMVSMIQDQLDRAAEDEHVKAVLLRVNSPGGEVLASDDIYRAIQKFQKATSKPVVASMESLAASGGYYVSVPCRWIVANELTITGSIGVIMSSYNYRGLMEKLGVAPEVYKSGKHKDMLSGSKWPNEITVEEKQMVQSLIDETFGRFKEVVQEGRTGANKANKSDGRTLVENWREYADGRILSGKQAYELGFVDELGNFDNAVERVLQIAGVGNANLVSYNPPFDLSNLFRIFGKSEAPALKIELGADLPKLQAGRLYFISSSLVH